MSRVWQHVKLSDVNLWTLPRHSFVVGEDVQPYFETNYGPMQPRRSKSSLEVWRMYSAVPLVHS